MISRLLAETPAVSRAALQSRAAAIGRPQPARLLSTAALLRQSPTRPAASAISNNWSTQRPVSELSALRQDTGSSSTRARLLSMTTGSRLVSRAYSTGANRRPIIYTASAGPFSLPRRHSALQFNRIGRGRNLVARRGIAATAAPRFVMHALRLPMGALTASLAGLSYAQYKVTGETSGLEKQGTIWHYENNHVNISYSYSQNIRTLKQGHRLGYESGG